MIRWNESKNVRLKRERGLSFEMVLEKIDANQFLSVERHPKRSNQWILVLELNGYPHVVPFIIEEDGSWFLKTIYPSRSAKKRFGGGYNSES